MERAGRENGRALAILISLRRAVNCRFSRVVRARSTVAATFRRYEAHLILPDGWDRFDPPAFLADVTSNGIHCGPMEAGAECDCIRRIAAREYVLYFRQRISGLFHHAVNAKEKIQGGKHSQEAGRRNLPRYRQAGPAPRRAVRGETLWRVTHALSRGDFLFGLVRPREG